MTVELTGRPLSRSHGIASVISSSSPHDGFRAVTASCTAEDTGVSAESGSRSRSGFCTPRRPEADAGRVGDLKTGSMSRWLWQAECSRSVWAARRSAACRRAWGRRGPRGTGCHLVVGMRNLSNSERLPSWHARTTTELAWAQPDIYGLTMGEVGVPAARVEGPSTTLAMGKFSREQARS
jgi:hypothetical protein